MSGVALEIGKFVNHARRTIMTTALRSILGDSSSPVWAPWLLLGAVVLYMVGYVDSGVHGAAIGSPAILGAVHEVFHHARHVAFMCH